MATTYITLSARSGWVQASPTTDWFLQNTQGQYLHITVQASAPDADAPYHELERGQSLTKIGTGNAYIRNPEPYEVKVPVTE